MQEYDKCNEVKKSIYKVGGAVRDELMGLTPNDIDYVAVGFCTDDFSHLPQVGKDFPVFIQEDGSELALARIERKIANGYNGFDINTTKVTIEQDLYRRDLTINSMAIDIKSDKLIDPYGGRFDIKNKILRHTSQAFIEDPLRVLRIARFQTIFSDFTIANETKELILKMKDELKYLQPNRVFKEIEKVLLLPNSSLFFKTLYNLEVLEYIFPSLYQLTLMKEYNIYHNEPSVFIHTMMILDELKNDSISIKLTALYHDIAKPIAFELSGQKHSGGHENLDFVEPLLNKDMQIPTKLKKNILFLIKNHTRIAKLNNMKATKFATFIESFKKNRKLFEDLIIFTNADSKCSLGIYTQPINDNFLLQIFDEISNYSPKDWIKQQNEHKQSFLENKLKEKKLTGKSIKQHIHKFNINIVKKYTDKLK